MAHGDKHIVRDHDSRTVTVQEEVVIGGKAVHILVAGYAEVPADTVAEVRNGMVYMKPNDRREPPAAASS